MSKKSSPIDFFGSKIFLSLGNHDNYFIPKRGEYFRVGSFVGNIVFRNRFMVIGIR